MTYNQLRHRASIAAPDIPLDLIDLFLTGRLLAFADDMPWEGLKREASISIPAAYSEGTIIASKGVAEISLNVASGAVWTAAMVQRNIVIEGRSYTIMANNGPAGITLDRPFEGNDTTEGGYRINTTRLAVPPEFDFVRAVRFSSSRSPNALVPWAQLQEIDPARMHQGYPQMAAWRGSWIEIYPAPSAADAAIIEYSTDDTNDSTTARDRQARDMLIFNGVMADIQHQRGAPGLAASYEAMWEQGLSQQRFRLMQRNGNQELRPMPGRFWTS